MLQISKSDVNRILQHAEIVYPEECCGVLLGRKEDLEHIVIQSRRLKNNAKEKTKRYEIDPFDLIELEKDLIDDEFDLIGIYHSHPNNFAAPSETDLNLAWENFSYIIVAMDKGSPSKLTSWRLVGSEFKEEIIQTI